MGDAHGAGQGQEFVLAVEQAELASVAGGELPHGQRGTGVMVTLGAGGPCRRHRLRSMNSSSATPPYGTTGPSRHNSSGPSWQWPHSPTPHCILRSSETLIRDGSIPMVDQLTCHETHHDLGATEQRHRPSRLEWRLGKEHGHQTHRTIPTGCADIDRDADVDPGRSPRLEVIGEEDLSRGAHPDQHEDPTRAPPAAFGQITYGPTQRSQPDPARHHHDVGRIVNGVESPIVPEGAAHADHRSDRGGAQRIGSPRPHRAQCAQWAPLPRVRSKSRSRPPPHRMRSAC